MLGEILAVFTALMWAASSIALAKTLGKVGPVRANAIRTFFSTLLMLPIAFVACELKAPLEVNMQGLLFVILAALIGFGIGNTLLYRSIMLMGVSRAYTISSTSPLFTMVMAILLLSEPFLPEYLIGTVLTVLGVIMISWKNGENDRAMNLRGSMTAITTAICHAITGILLALGLRYVDIFLANAVRFPLLSLFLFLLSRPRKKWEVDRGDLLLLFVSGALGMVLGGITYLLSIQLIGVSRVTPLSSSSPVWASVMASIFLKEKVTLRLLLSSVIVVIGTYFLVR